MLQTTAKTCIVMGGLQQGIVNSRSLAKGSLPAPLGLHRRATNIRHRSGLSTPGRRSILQLTVVNSYDDYGNRRSGGPTKSAKPFKLDAKTILDFALPTIALIGIASLVAPFLVGFLVSAITVGVAITAAAAFFSVSSLFLPFLIPAVGVPLLVGGGIVAGLFAIPALIQMAVIAAGLGFGAWLTRNIFFPSDTDGSSTSSDGTIDVEANTVEDWVADIEKEARRREQELRDFDEILRRREDFKKGRY